MEFLNVVNKVRIRRLLNSNILIPRKTQDFIRLEILLIQPYLRIRAIFVSFAAFIVVPHYLRLVKKMSGSQQTLSSLDV
jgi:hypothetical protein